MSYQFGPARSATQRIELYRRAARRETRAARRRWSLGARRCGDGAVRRRSVVRLSRRDRGIERHRASGRCPLIRADARPMKVKPDKPGGMEIPDRDSADLQPRTVPASSSCCRRPRRRCRARARRHAAAPAAPPRRARLRRRQRRADRRTGAGRAAARPSRRQTPTPAAKSAEPAGRPGGMRLQLGAVRSEDAARRNGTASSGTTPICSASLSASRSAPISATAASFTGSRRGRSR